MGRASSLSLARASLGRLRRETQARSRWLATGPSFEYTRQSDDDPTPRKICIRCGFVHYQNPKVVCGSVLTTRMHDNDLYVLGRRTIEPRCGYWGIPAGFMEMGETSEQGAAREASEELNANIAVQGLLAVYNLPHIGQIQMIYSSVLVGHDRKGGGSQHAAAQVSAGQETDKVAFFRWEEIPWDNLAFPTTSWALLHHRQRHTGNHLLSTGDARESKLHRKEDLLGTEESTEVTGDVGVVDASRTIQEPVDFSAETVFSSPTSDHALFWSPQQGLHVKDDWSSATDS